MGGAGSEKRPWRIEYRPAVQGVEKQPSGKALEIEKGEEPQAAEWGRGVVLKGAEN
jgi:hypothetical protein